MPPQPRANRPESETGGRITNVPTLARIGFLAGVFRVRRPFGRFLRRVAPKAHRRARPAAEADRVTPKAHPCPRPAAKADRSVRAGACEHAVRPAARRA